jgi:hypothetical protein
MENVGENVHVSVSPLHHERRFGRCGRTGRETVGLLHRALRCGGQLWVATGTGKEGGKEKGKVEGRREGDGRESARATERARMVRRESQRGLRQGLGCEGLKVGA